MIYNMPSLKNLYFEYNQLSEIPANAFNNISLLEIIDFSHNQLTTFELWTLDVKTKVDLSNNNITTITNKYFYTNILNRPIAQAINLTNNGPTINFTDAVYEMYNQCDEAYRWYFTAMSNITEPWFTVKMTYIDFGTTTINCNCDQSYFLHILRSSHYATGTSLPISTATCSNFSLNTNDTTFLNSSCVAGMFDNNSTVNFSQIYPRLCKIAPDEEGVLTNTTMIAPPLLNVVRNLY